MNNCKEAGLIYRRSFRKSIAQKADIRKQLDDFEDHRPYFTYWITTVQILILIISLACYGFGPVGLDLHHRSSLVSSFIYFPLQLIFFFRSQTLYIRFYTYFQSL
jgi:hypothetical protein